jgi:pimeloyl-ACP methyl ester carboxylesterase
MKIPEWIKPGIYGAVAGGIAVAVVGFSWGGWVTASSAQTSGDKRVSTAVTEALTPYCVERSRTDPRAIDVLAELKAATSSNRRGIIEKSGWATPAGTETPSRELAQSCQIALVAAITP